MKTKAVQLRLSESEKASFQQAADLAGITVSSWMRERLRLAAIKELSDSGIKAVLIEELVKEFRDG